MFIWIRTLVYWVGLAFLTTFCFLLILLGCVAPHRVRHSFAQAWVKGLLWLLKHVCGLSYKVVGAENIPDTPSIICSKHQSGWETLALQAIFPPQVFVAKKELLWIPFFGWGLALLDTIAIDRSAKTKASQQIVEQGRQRIAKGYWIAVFPEGTRTPPGVAGRYQQGAARMAKAFDVPMVPVALNAGEFWPKNSFRKFPGEITVVIGKPILPQDKSSAAMTREAEEWIEARQLEIGGVGPFAHPDQRKRRLGDSQPA